MIQFTWYSTYSRFQHEDEIPWNKLYVKIIYFTIYTVGSLILKYVTAIDPVTKLFK